MPPEKQSQEAANPELLSLVMKEAKELVRSLEGTGTKRMTVELGSVRIEVERGVEPLAAGAAAAYGSALAGANARPASTAIVSPLVGIFYSAPSPGAKSFIEVGDTVERGQKVGIVEAMKIMNEVTSEYQGVVTEILVENGSAVAFEQPLILLDTSGTAAAGS